MRHVVAKQADLGRRMPSDKAQDRVQQTPIGEAVRREAAHIVPPGVDLK
jgi:hypothetical protein